MHDERSPQLLQVQENKHHELFKKLNINVSNNFPVEVHSMSIPMTVKENNIGLYTTHSQPNPVIERISYQENVSLEKKEPTSFAGINLPKISNNIFSPNNPFNLFQMPKSREVAVPSLKKSLSHNSHSDENEDPNDGDYRPNAIYDSDEYDESLELEESK